MSWVTELHLQNFRCYEAAKIGGLLPGPVVLYGVNGAGKTNLLEAVSLLSPGKGIRGARASEIQRSGAAAGDPAPQAGLPTPAAPWAVAARVQTRYGEVRIGTGRDPAKERRGVRINGSDAKGQAALAEYLSCVWLTPQMDRLFLDSASGRRRFLDRLVYAFDPGHAGRVTRYENAMSQRARVLKEYRHPDPAWLDGLETTMAGTGAAIAAARREFTQRLQQAIHARPMGDSRESLFPRAQLTAAGTLEELLGQAPALEVEEMFRYQLRQTRELDAVSGGAATGPHKSEFSCRYLEKDMPAAQCSTGEQKALLIGIVLAHARLIAAERGAPPILLLDEVSAHLDEGRRNALYELLLEAGGQVWLTGTDRMLFEGLEENARFFEVRGSAVTEACAPRAA
jgi:DNA replication and repair protein RecF